MSLHKVVHVCNYPRMETTLITTAEVAQRLGVSIPTVNRWVRDGRLEPVQKLPGIRGANLFHPDAIAGLKETA